MARKAKNKTTKKPAKRKAEATLSKTSEELRYEIDQLRKDKIVYALEAISATLAALLFWVVLNINVPRQFIPEARNLYNLGFAIALIYWLFTVIGNTYRLIKIKKLEKELLKVKQK